MSRSFWAPAVVVIVSGLILLLASAAGWVDAEDARTVGGVVVTEPRSLSGTTFAPMAVVFGLAGLVTGVLLAIVRGSARKAVAILAVVLGIVGSAVVAGGSARARDAQGAVTPAPFFATLAVISVGMGGVLALRAPARPPETSRYRVESERPEDDEWTVASGDSE